MNGDNTAPYARPSIAGNYASEPMKQSKLKRQAITVVAIMPGVILSMMIVLVVPVMPAIAAHFGGTTNGGLLAQYFVAISGIGVIVGAALGGLGADRIGFRRVVTWSLTLFIAAGITGGFVNSPALALIARVFVGVGAGAFATGSMALLAHIYDGDQRAKMLGYITAAGTVAGLLLVIASGFVGEALGWRAAFLLYGLALPILICGFAVPSTSRQSDSGPKTSWNDWLPLLPVLIGGMVLYVVLFTVTIQLPLLLADAGFVHAGERSLILAVPSLFGFMGGMLFAPLSKKLGTDRMMVLILSFFALGLTAMCLLQHGLALALLVGLLCGFAMGISPSHISDQLLQKTPINIRGRASAALVASRYLAHFLNPVIIGSLGAILGLRTALLVVVALLVLSIFYFLPKIFRRAHQMPAT